MLNLASDSNRSSNSLSLIHLPAEIIDQILLEVKSYSTYNTNSSLLPLLFVHRSLTPYLRRILFKSTTLGALNSKEKLFLECLEAGKIGKHVLELKVVSTFDLEQICCFVTSLDGRGKNLNSNRHRYSSQALYEVDIATILSYTHNLLRLVIKFDLFTQVVSSTIDLSHHMEGINCDRLAQSNLNQAKLNSVKVGRAFRLMTDLQELTIDLSQTSGMIGILVNQISFTPYLVGLPLWHNLTSLTLSSLYVSVHATLSAPRYHLKNLHLSRIKFDSIDSFRWLAGIGRIESSDFICLDSLTLVEIEFDSHPLSSEPLLSLFTPSSSIFNSLKSLRLHLIYPTTDDWNTPFSLSLLTNFIHLKVLHLGGPGITRNFINSLVPAITSPNIIRPASTLEDIILSGTTRLPLPFLSDFFHRSTLASNSNWSNLVCLEFNTPLKLNVSETASRVLPRWNLIPRKDWKDILKWGRLIPLLSSSSSSCTPYGEGSDKKGFVSIFRDGSVVEGDDDSGNEEEDAWWEDEDDDMDPYVSEREINRGRR